MLFLYVSVGSFLGSSELELSLLLHAALVVVLTHSVRSKTQKILSEDLVCYFKRSVLQN